MCRYLNTFDCGHINEDEVLNCEEREHASNVEMTTKASCVECIKRRDPEERFQDDRSMSDTGNLAQGIRTPTVESAM